MCDYRFHIQLAMKYKLPLYLHIRNAHKDCIHVLTEEKYIYDPSTLILPTTQEPIEIRPPPPPPPTIFTTRDASANTNNTANSANTTTNNIITSNATTSSTIQTYSTITPNIIHCFTGTYTELQIYLSLGFYIGITGYIINCPIDKNIEIYTEEIRMMLLSIGLHRLLIETDCPYMGFIGCRISENEGMGENNLKNLKSSQKKKNMTQKYPNIPSSLLLLVQYIHTVTKWNIDDIIYNTTLNAVALFKITD